jgi:hypothetical protein
MKRFRSFISEGKYPLWLRITIGGMIIKMKNLQNQIEVEKDPIEQNKLISQQNSLLSYIGVLGIGVGSTDKILLKRLKGMMIGPKK